MNDVELVTVEALGGDVIDQGIDVRAGANLKACHYFELQEGGIRRWAVAIDFGEWPSPFKETLIWTQASVALAGAQGKVFALDLQSGAVKKEIDLESYFGQMCLSEDQNNLYVASGNEAYKFDRALKQLWRSQDLAMDGIIFHEVGEKLRVHAEMDPPGGWQEVVLDPHTGEELSRSECLSPE